jgi:hypothetical protein
MAADAAPSGRIERATRKARGAAVPGGFAEVRQRTLTIYRVPLAGACRQDCSPGAIRRQRSQPEWAEAHRDSAPRFAA